MGGTEYYRLDHADNTLNTHYSKYETRMRIITKTYLSELFRNASSNIVANEEEQKKREYDIAFQKQQDEQNEQRKRTAKALLLAGGVILALLAYNQSRMGRRKGVRLPKVLR